MAHAFLFPVGTKLTSSLLVNDRSAAYLNGYHAKVEARVVNADTGVACYVIRSFYYCEDQYSGDSSLTPATVVEDAHSVFVPPKD